MGCKACSSSIQHAEACRRDRGGGMYSEPWCCLVEARTGAGMLGGGMDFVSVGGSGVGSLLYCGSAGLTLVDGLVWFVVSTT